MDDFFVRNFLQKILFIGYFFILTQKNAKKWSGIFSYHPKGLKDSQRPEPGRERIPGLSIHDPSGHNSRAADFGHQMNKLWAAKTLRLAWKKVQTNKGGAGVDGQGIERFVAQAGNYDGLRRISVMAGCLALIEGVQHWMPTAGTPPGAVLSPLLANIYLPPAILITPVAV